jgi:hypothetical protein
MTIRIHYRDQHSGPWATAIREVRQIPQVVDFIVPAPINVFRVVMALHVLFETDYDAEVQAETLEEEPWRG